MDSLIDNYKKYFSKNDEYKVVFEMGDDIDDVDLRIKQVVSRFEKISEFLFKEKSIWIILVIWNKEMETLSDLENCGFNFKDCDFHEKGDEKNNPTDFNISNEDEIHYLFYNYFNFNSILPIVKAIAGYEIGGEPSANISAFFLNFNKNIVLLNLYDDRGLEVLSPNKELIENIQHKFKAYTQVE